MKKDDGSERRSNESGCHRKREEEITHTRTYTEQSSGILSVPESISSARTGCACV